MIRDLLALAGLPRFRFSINGIALASSRTSYIFLIIAMPIIGLQIYCFKNFTHVQVADGQSSFKITNHSRDWYAWKLESVCQFLSSCRPQFVILVYLQGYQQILGLFRVGSSQLPVHSQHNRPPTRPPPNPAGTRQYRGILRTFKPNQIYIVTAT